jgi:hypothetical protein
MLMAHSLGESGNYHRPTETQLSEDYLKAADLLTINEENRLSKRINELQEKNMEKDYLIRGKLQEKDEQINQLISKQEKFEQLIQSIIDSGQLKPKKIN